MLESSWKSFEEKHALREKKGIMTCRESGGLGEWMCFEILESGSFICHMTFEDG
jgi:hypothetical protein